jgi:hypothetical protein
MKQRLKLNPQEQECINLKADCSKCSLRFMPLSFATGCQMPYALKKLWGAEVVEGSPAMYRTNIDTLYLIWKHPLTGKQYAVGELQRTFFRYYENSQLWELIKEGVFQGYPAFRLSGNGYLRAVDVFMQRTVPTSRVDYSDYLKAHGLPTDQPIEPFTLLAYTGAKVPEDPFYLTTVPPYLLNKG